MQHLHIVMICVDAYRLAAIGYGFIGRMAKLPLVLVKAAGRRVTGKGRQGVL